MLLVVEKDTADFILEAVVDELARVTLENPTDLTRIALLLNLIHQIENQID